MDANGSLCAERNKYIARDYGNRAERISIDYKLRASADNQMVVKSWRQITFVQLNILNGVIVRMKLEN